MLRPWHENMSPGHVDRMLGAGHSVHDLAEAHALLYVAKMARPNLPYDDAARLTVREISRNPAGPVGRLFARALAEAAQAVLAIQRRN